MTCDADKNLNLVSRKILNLSEAHKKLTMVNRLGNLTVICFLDNVKISFEVKDFSRILVSGYQKHTARRAGWERGCNSQPTDNVHSKFTELSYILQ